MDLHDDGEWWAILNPRPGVNTARIAGSIQGVRVEHDEAVSVPAAWMSSTYPVTLLAVPETPSK